MDKCIGKAEYVHNFIKDYFVKKVKFLDSSLGEMQPNALMKMWKTKCFLYKINTFIKKREFHKIL